MTVTFGTRSAMRELADELEEGEAVLELAACAYAGAAGLVALTSERVLAIRDDYSKHQVQFARIPEVVWIDYLPKVAAEQKVALNLVRMFPADYGTEKKISLSLENVPMTSVLDYVAQLGGLKLEYQAHAVVLSRAPAQ